jgi:hypothetical protein
VAQEICYSGTAQILQIKAKEGKAIPLQAWTGSRRLRLPDFKTIGT